LFYEFISKVALKPQIGVGWGPVGPRGPEKNLEKYTKGGEQLLFYEIFSKVALKPQNRGGVGPCGPSGSG